MIIFDAPVTPDDLTTFVRLVPTPSTLGLSTLFPETTSDSNTVDWAEIAQTNRTARFRTFDGRIHVSARDGFSEKKISMLPLSDSLNMGEFERLQLEFARTGGSRYGALSNAIYNDSQNLVRYMRNRMEQAIGDVLTDGKLTINEGGLVGAEADFGVPANQLITAGTVWTNPSAPILDNLIAWVDVYVAANGFAPGSMVMSNLLRRAMSTNTQLIGAAVGSSSGKTRINNDELTSLLDSLGLPSQITTYDTVLDVDGTATRPIPADRVVFLPPNPSDLLEVRYGVSATALELVDSNESDLSFEDAPGIVGVVEKVGPPYRQFTFVDAVGMPILKNARQLMVADCN